MIEIQSAFLLVVEVYNLIAVSHSLWLETDVTQRRGVSRMGGVGQWGRWIDCSIGGRGSVESRVRVCASTVGMRLLLTKLGLCDWTWKREDSTTEPLYATTSHCLSARGWI